MTHKASYILMQI